jgi:hypothetical protein
LKTLTDKNYTIEEDNAKGMKEERDSRVGIQRKWKNSASAVGLAYSSKSHIRLHNAS